jgi:DNA-binding NtrC family response regulator
MKELPGFQSASETSLDGMEKIADVERAHIKKMLDRLGWNIGQTAELLGIHRNTLRTKIKEYNLSQSE